MRFLKSPLSFIIGSCCFIFTLIHLSKDNRVEYESFLNNQYKHLDISTLDPSKKEIGFTNPEMAALQNYYMTIDPNIKRVPSERLKSAFQKSQSISKSTFKHATEDISWQTIDSDMGGRTRAIMYDPNDVNRQKVWAGSVTGGLWYNDDITSSSSPWVAVESFWSSISISSIVSDPNNTQHFYVGTGEAQTARSIYRESSGIGGGIWKSEDGGSSWNVIPSTSQFKYITDIVIRDENGSSVIYAGVTSGVYKGSSHESAPSDGLYRSDDNGTTWQQVLPNINGFDKPFAVADVKIGPSGTLYVGSMRNLDGNGGSTILYSELGTVGSWTIYDDFEEQVRTLNTTYNIPGRVIVAPAPSNENRIYAIFGAGWINAGTGFIHSRGQYILRSDDKGASWQQVNIPTGTYPWATLSWHAFEATVSPVNEDILYVGGLDVYKTENGGTNWNQLSDWRGTGSGFEYIHADIHNILFNPQNSNELLIATDGGLFYSANAQLSIPAFFERNKSYGTLQFYTCAISPSSDTFLGGLQDNGTVQYQGSTLNKNHVISGGDGAYCFFDPNDDLFITSVYYNRYYLFKNNTFNRNMNNFADISGTFINPADYDWKNNILYANGVTFLGQNENKILRISNIDGIPVQELVNMTFNNSAAFSHLKISPHASNGSTTLYAGTESGRLYKISDAQSSPTSEEIGSSSFPTGNISCIDIGNSADTIVTCFSNYGVSSIWQTYDAGESWQEKEGNLPDMPIRWIIYNPLNSKKALIATELGVWFTDELHLSNPEWVPVNDGLANVRVDMLQVRDSDHKILAATHGRGLAVASFGLLGIDDLTSTDESFIITPNPCTDVVNLQILITEPETIQIQFYDLSGRLIRSYEELTITGTFRKSFDISTLESGTYLLKLISPTKSLNQKIIKI